MSEAKLDARTPVWVEIVPTVMELEVTPGADPPLDCAPAGPGAVTTRVARNADDIRAVAPIAFNPCLDLRPIRCSTLLYTSPRGCRSLYPSVFTGSFHPHGS